ncbi:putative protein phosphatase 2C 14 [Bienertia sinuspersici]
MHYLFFTINYIFLTCGYQIEAHFVVANVNHVSCLEDKGGYIEFHKGAWRVRGILSVSRRIGDAHLKDWVVSEPETKTLNLIPNIDYLVLASDGLWEEVENQEAIDIVLQSCVIEKKPEISLDELENKNQKMKRVSVIKRKKKTTLSPCYRKTENISTVKVNLSEFDCENDSPPTKLIRTSLFSHKKNKRPVVEGLVAACKKLANLAVSRGSMDDITVMLVDLKHFRSGKSKYALQSVI